MVAVAIPANLRLVEALNATPRTAAPLTNAEALRKTGRIWPNTLRELAEEELPAVAEAIRADIIDSVRRTGGHFAGNLGAVELATALHYVYHTPYDQLVWDTGHQAYGHKMLTGRWDRLGSIRQRGGLSGFPRRDESVYDTFGVGHAGTAIGAALGMAMSQFAKRSGIKTVAVVGDGSLGAGMALEALNHGGETDADLLVIVNHNGMSISRGVGALTGHLGVLGERSHAPDLTGGLPPRQDDSVFESLGFASYGPVDGHDVIGLARTLRRLRTLGGPRVLHVMTQKGRGFPAAEENPTAYHAVSPGSSKAATKPAGRSVASFSDVFGDWLMTKAVEDERLVCITPAMIDGSGLVGFSQAHPDRLFDVGIAEQHAVTFAAGLATTGQKPVVAIYSSFLQRAFDQLVHDVALQRLAVLFAIDRAGIVGPDGATHAGGLDLSFLRCVPNLCIAAPADGPECTAALDCAYAVPGPSAVRYPRGSAAAVLVKDATPEMAASAAKPWKLGQGRLLRRGRGVAILSFGALLPEVLEAAEALDATVADMRWVKPLDETLIARLAADHELLVTVEDNAIAGGAGSGVCETLARRGLHAGLLNLGLPDRFLEHGSRGEILAQCGLDAEGIERSVNERRRQRERCARLDWR